MPPLQGLIFGGDTLLLHRCRPYGTKEAFWLVQSLWRKPGAVGNSKEIPKQNPTGPGTTTVICSKIDTYGSVSQPHRILRKNLESCKTLLNPVGMVSV